MQGTKTPWGAHPFIAAALLATIGVALIVHVAHTTLGLGSPGATS